MLKTALVGLCVTLFLAIPFATAIPANVAAAQGYTIVPGNPIAFVTSYYGGATLPVRFTLLNPEGNPVADANATMWVWWPGLPAPIAGTASGKSNLGMGNMFRFDPDGMMYMYTLNTKPFPAGPGSGQVTFIIKVTQPAALEWSTMIHLN